MPFSRVDRNLLVRVAQVLRAEAEVALGSHGPWTQQPESVLEKARYDRLVLDAGDLEQLRRRMEKEHPEMKVMVLVPKPPVGHGG